MLDTAILAEKYQELKEWVFDVLYYLRDQEGYEVESLLRRYQELRNRYDL